LHEGTENKSCLSLARIVLVRAIRAKQNRIFRLRKSCYSCHSCEDQSITRLFFARKAQSSLFKHELHERHDIDKSMTRLFLARMARKARYRQVDDTIISCTNDTMSINRQHDFLCTNGTNDIDKSMTRLFLARMARRKNRVFRLRKSYYSCHSCEGKSYYFLTSSLFC
jgi:hypothetical protein